MKKVIGISSALSAFLSFAPLAFAGTDVTICPKDQNGFLSLCSFNFSNFIPALVTTLFIVAIVVALIYLIWGGFKWLMSGGDKAAVGSAREHIVAAIVGLVIIFLAYFILNFILSFFHITNASGGFVIPPAP